MAVRTDSQTRAWRSTFSARLVRTQMIVLRSAASAADNAVRNDVDVGGALPADPVQRGGVGEVEPVGRGDVLDEVLALARRPGGS